MVLPLLGAVFLPTPFQGLQTVEIEKTTNVEGCPCGGIKQRLIEIVPDKEGELFELKNHDDHGVDIN